MIGLRKQIMAGPTICTCALIVHVVARAIPHSVYKSPSWIAVKIKNGVFPPNACRKILVLEVKSKEKPFTRTESYVPRSGRQPPACKTEKGPDSRRRVHIFFFAAKGRNATNRIVTYLTLGREFARALVYKDFKEYTGKFFY